MSQALKQLSLLWTCFWFEPKSPSPVCIFRIFYGLLTLIQVSCLIPDFLNWFGCNGISPVETIKKLEVVPRLSVLFWLPQSDTITIALFVLYIFSILCLTIGLHTRLSAFLVWLLMTSFHFRNPYYWFSADAVFRLYAFALFLAPAEARYSVDAWFKKRAGTNQENKLYAPWAQRLIQCQIATVYFKAFWGKLCGQTWWNGTAAYYAVHQYFGSWLRYPVPYIFDHQWTVSFLTWGTLAIELSLWSLIWFKSCRYWVLLGGIILHAGINWCLNIDSLESVMVIGYINFVEPADLECVLAYARRRLFSKKH